MANDKCIVAMGGGGFMMEPSNPLLDRWILSLARRARPKVCFLPTASGDADGVQLRFYEGFSRFDCQPDHLTLFRRRHLDLPTFLREQDVIYVGGGNTANMLAIWRVHGVDQILREIVEEGVVLAGLSAGSLCWYEAGVTDSFGPLRALQDGLGLLSGSHCPHYDGEVHRRPTYLGLVESGELPAGVAVDDGVALRYTNDELVEVVSERPKGRAFRVSLRDGVVCEDALDVRYLGDEASA